MKFSVFRRFFGAAGLGALLLPAAPVMAANGWGAPAAPYGYAPQYQAAPQGYYPMPQNYMPAYPQNYPQMPYQSYVPPGYGPQGFAPQGYPPVPGFGQQYPQMPDFGPVGPGGWTRDDFFGGDNPLQNPFENHGWWADRNFKPWRSGPFERDRWTRNHPMSNMPWGSFPGWGDGFFGGFGPDDWDGITPWGNDVPFRWIDPTDPRKSIGRVWDDALNTPSKLGRMPPGWTAPYISVPNPVEVEEEFERNGRNFPEEMRKMFSTGSVDLNHGADGDK